MAVSTTTELKILVKTAGDKNLDRLSRQLDNIGKNTVQADFKFDKFSRSLQRQERQATKNISNMRAFAASWRELANSVDITSKEFRQATAEAQRLERQIAKTTRAGAKGKGAGALGAIGAAGFLGPEQLLGAGVGALFGAPLAGAAVATVTVTPAKQIAAGMAESVAEINKYRIALAGVSKDQEDYAKSVQSIQQYTKDFLLPLGETTAQYTRLKASVAGAGLTTAETDKVFRGISAAIIATGGNAESLNAALTATSQVFSKGKVSAEELRQQIGERLPGAFTIFAQSMGKTPAELDKALEQGEVSLEDFITFAEELFDRYGTTAEILASAPENAGARLKVALNEATQNYGGFFQQVGAFLQDNQTRLVNWLNANSKIIKQYITDWVNAGYRLAQVFTRIGNGVITLAKRIHDFLKFTQPQFLFGDVIRQAIRNLLGVGPQAGPGKFTPEDLFPDFKPLSFGTGLGGGAELAGGDGEGLEKTKEKLKQVKTVSKEILELAILKRKAQEDNNALEEALINYQIDLQKITEQFNAGEIDFNYAKKADLEAQGKLQDNILKLRTSEQNELKKLSEGQKELNKQLSDAEVLGKNVLNTFAQGMGDALMNLIDRATSFRDILSDLLRQTARLLINFGFQSLFKGLFPSLFATGGVMTGKGPVPLKKYASGGIANSPQLAMFGEGSKPEAYVPLPDGRSIPVKIKGNGAGGSNIVVNVDAGGSNVQGDGAQAKALGAAIGAAVQNEILKQKKPGGLLY